MIELQFRKGHAKVLKNIADDLRKTFPKASKEKGSAASLFDRAARAAKAGRPLKVKDNAAGRAMAQAITFHGGPEPRLVED